MTSIQRYPHAENALDSGAKETSREVAVGCVIFLAGR